jgi:hypothetical protein
MLPVIYVSLVPNPAINLLSTNSGIDYQNLSNQKSLIIKTLQK